MNYSELNNEQKAIVDENIHAVERLQLLRDADHIEVRELPVEAIEICGLNG